MRAHLALTLLAGTLALPATANAQTQYQVLLCAEYQTTLDDAHWQFGDDLWLNNSPKPARGALYRIRDADTLAILHTGHLNVSGSSPGCMSAPVNLDYRKKYRFQVLSRADINGNHVVVRPPDYPENLYTYWEEHTIIGPTTVTLTTSANPLWNLSAVGSFALLRQPAGLSGKEIEIFNHTDVQGTNFIGWFVRDTSHSSHGDYCPEGDVGDVCMWNDARRHKYFIAQTFAHAVMARANYDLPGNYHQEALPVNCPNYVSGDETGFDLFSREWGSAAVAEGTAYAYAASVFNYTHHLDCKLVDWRPTDPDGDALPDSAVVNCADGFQATSDYIPDHDYFSWVPCSGPAGVANVATSYDWTRFWWSMLTQEGLTFTDVMNIWVEASPHSWWASGTSGAPANPAWPSQRIKTAAYDLGFKYEYEAQKHHGVDQ